jgi:hypothetical protein
MQALRHTLSTEYRRRHATQMKLAARLLEDVRAEESEKARFRKNNSVGGAKRSLGDAKSSLGDAKSSLGDAKSSLGDAESSLGDAKSSLGDAKSSLGDA